MQIRISQLREGPEELFDQLPIVGTMLRLVQGPDRPDYWLVQLVRPLFWFDRGVERAIPHLLLASRFTGVPLTPGVSGVTAGISLVTDAPSAEPAGVDFDRCVHVGIGDCDVLACPTELD